MSDIQTFGKLCPTCQKFAQFGKIDIQAGAPPSLLRAKLVEIDWQGDSILCETPKCNTRIFGEPGQMMLRVPS
jgi:hypothetical protein